MRRKEFSKLAHRPSKTRRHRKWCINWPLSRHQQKLFCKIGCTAGSPISWQSHDLISTALCHSIQFNSPNVVPLRNRVTWLSRYERAYCTWIKYYSTLIVWLIEFYFMMKMRLLIVKPLTLENLFHRRKFISLRHCDILLTCPIVISSCFRSWKQRCRYEMWDRKGQRGKYINKGDNADTLMVGKTKAKKWGLFVGNQSIRLA